MKCSLLVLSSYLDGELEVRRQGELEAHLVGCQRCRSGLGYLREEVERISSLGRVSVPEHSMQQLLVQLGLAEPEPEIAEHTAAYWHDQAPGHDDFVAASAPAGPEPAIDENRVDMTGSPLHGGSFWEPPDLTPPELAPTVPHAAVPPAPPPATAAPPPTPARQWPPPAEPSAAEPVAAASEGDAEMTASPTWTPREAPPEPQYPLTDEDVLEDPMPVERFGPPTQARPGFFERLRDRIAVRRALSRSAAEFDDSVQIVSGSGAPLRPGRVRAEVERRRHEAMLAGAAPMGDDPLAEDAADPGDEVDLGPLPPTAPFVAPGNAPMPRPSTVHPAAASGGLPGQLAIPGTDEHPSRQVMGTPLPPLPPHRHTLESAIGAVPPPMSPPPGPPSPPKPDLLAEALSDYERSRSSGIPMAEPRPWRPREIPEDAVPAAPAAPVEPPQARPERAAPVERSRHSPSQLRESRRLLALFGAATLVMLIVGVVSGRTSTPLPSSTATSTQSSQGTASHPAQSAPAARASTPAAPAIAPRSSAPAAPVAPAPAAGAPQLTGTKVLGDSGSGYQVKDFRYGVHPGDFRIVLDIDPAGNASGTPKATIGFSDPTTMLVAIEGVLPAGSTGSLPPGSPVVSVTQLNPSPFPGAITYQLKLSHPVSLSAGYLSGPLRLVLDLA